MSDEDGTTLDGLEDTIQMYGREEVEEKIAHYRRNRDRLVQELSDLWANPKTPAISGVIVLLPIAVTVYVLYWFFTKVNLIPGGGAFALTPYPLVNALLKTFAGLVVVFLAVIAVGKFVRTRPGHRLERALDRSVEKIPVIRFIYSLTKVATDTALTGTEEFREPVKLEFQGARITAFKTGNTAQDGHLIVFVPTAPNITTGFVLEVDPDDIIETDETTEHALKRVLSAGLAGRPDEGRP